MQISRAEDLVGNAAFVHYISEIKWLHKNIPFFHSVISGREGRAIEAEKERGQIASQQRDNFISFTKH